MRFLFVVFPEPGHLHPMLAVAQHLARAGHDVAFFSMEDLSPRLAAAGLTARCDFAEAGSREGPRPTRSRDLAALLLRPAFARRWYRYVILTQVPAQIAALRDVVRAARPDVIAIDPLAYAGVVVAEQERIPWASLSTQLLALTPRGFSCPYLEYLGELAPERDRLLAAAGVAARFELGEAVSPWLSTVFATEAFAPSDRRGRHAICVGPPTLLGPRGDERPFPWERLRGGVPLVYASFGSQVAPPAAVYEALERALPPGEVDLVIAHSGQAPPPAPPHVIAVAWAPQLALLDRAAVMVNHGGVNSVTECLTRGKPMLVVPLPADQPLQACLVERSGVGMVLTPEAAAIPEALGAALRALLADGPHRRRAAEIGRSYAATDGARRAAELLIELGQTRAPIPIGA